jgi:hypothetical protein
MIQKRIILFARNEQEEKKRVARLKACPDTNPEGERRPGFAWTTSPLRGAWIQVSRIVKHDSFVLLAIFCSKAEIQALPS